MTFAEEIQQQTAAALHRLHEEAMKKKLEEEERERQHIAYLAAELPKDLENAKAQISEAAKKGKREVYLRDIYGNLKSVAKCLTEEGLNAEYYEETIHHSGGMSDDAYDQDIRGVIVKW